MYLSVKSFSPIVMSFSQKSALANLNCFLFSVANKLPAEMQSQVVAIMLNEVQSSNKAKGSHKVMYYGENCIMNQTKYCEVHSLYFPGKRVYFKRAFTEGAHKK